jgi:hypothetical protein
MFCPNCGAEVAEGAKFCPQCGQPVAQAPTPADSAEKPQPTAPTPGQAAAQPPRAEGEAAPVVSRLDEGGWARIVFSLGLLGLLFIAFTRFSGPYLLLSVSFPTNQAIGYGTGLSVLGILLGGGMLGAGFVLRERLGGLITDTELLLIGGGVAAAAILMMIPNPSMGEIGWFVFELLISVVLVVVGLNVLRASDRFTENKAEVICGRVVAFSLLVFALFTAITGAGILLRSVTLSVDLPNVFLIISSITGLLGVLGFVGATVLRLLGLKPGR